MNDLAVTYQDIADIISFEVSETELKKRFKSPSFSWDAIVKEGSRHYVIPTIYCKLKEKKLIKNLPKDLFSYFEYITNENRLRNEIILKQVHAISTLFKEYNITHVFLKGSALLSMEYYNDIAERMIGDIDILVIPHQVHKAQELLCKNGYTASEQTLGNDFFEHKHLPRLETKVTATRIAAVEVHQKLFMTYRFEPLSIDRIFKEKVIKNRILGPSQKHLLMHNILNFQINDYGKHYKNINLRSAYDTLVIQNTYRGYKDWYKIEPFKSYFHYISLFFNEIKINSRSTTNIKTHFYLFKLKHLSFYKGWNKIIKLKLLVPIFFTRIWFFISKKAYRSAIVNDRNRIYNHFKSILKDF